VDLCDPENSDESLKTLTNFALSVDDKALANWISPSLNKRKRRFESMDDFYKALKEYGKKDEQIEKIKSVLLEQEIDVMELTTLTDAKLKEDGLTQRGLREAVLSVIENV
jgi:hypothetical protein